MPTRRWGSVARRGASLVREAGPTRGEPRRPPPAPPAPRPWQRADGASEWADSEWPARRGATSPKAPRRAPSPGSGGRSREAAPVAPGPAGARPGSLPADIATQIRKAAATATARHREILVSTMEEAVVAYERGRYAEASRGAKLVADEAPGVEAVRELAGLAAYRSGKWRDAVRHLEALSAIGEGTDHVPALMDSYRALGRRARVSEQWSELRRRSPGADVLAEARMVAAGTLADGGDLTGAIALLAGSGAAKALRNPADRHLRQWYALGDLYERAGDMPRARELFARVARADPDAYDASERLEGLGPERPRRLRRRPATREGRTPVTREGGAPATRDRPGPATRGPSGPGH